MNFDEASETFGANPSSHHGESSSNTHDQQQKLEEYRKRVDRHKRRISSLENTIQSLRSTRDTLQGRVKKLKNQLEQTTIEVQKKEDKIEDLSQRIKNSTQTIRKARQERNEAKSRVRRQSQKMAALRDRVERLKSFRKSHWLYTAGFLLSVIGASIMALFSLSGMFSDNQSPDNQERNGSYRTYSLFLAWILLILGFFLQFLGIW